MSPQHGRPSRPDRCLGRARCGTPEVLDVSDATNQVQEAVEALVERDNPLTAVLEGQYGSLRGLGEADLCGAIGFILIARLYFLRISACEIRDTLQTVLSDLDETKGSGGGALARHLASAQALERRLDELADWTEQRAVELDPDESWVGLSPEEFLFGAN
jgi:hypothetical protein